MASRGHVTNSGLTTNFSAQLGSSQPFQSTSSQQFRNNSSQLLTAEVVSVADEAAAVSPGDTEQTQDKAISASEALPSHPEESAATNTDVEGEQDQVGDVDVPDDDDAERQHNVKASPDEGGV